MQQFAMISLAAFSEAIVAVAAFLAALTAIWKWLGIGTFKSGIDRFLHDWNGEPARPGYAGRLSFPERLTAVEKEFKPNGGGSLRDLANKAATVGEAALHKAEEAATMGVEISATIGSAEKTATLQRTNLDYKVDALALALANFAADTRRRERRYVEALRDKNEIDLTGVTEDLNDDELEGR